MFEYDVTSLIQNRAVYGQFRSPNTAVVLSDQSDVSANMLNLFTDWLCFKNESYGWECTTSEFWAVSQEQLPGLMAQLHTAAWKSFRDYENVEDDAMMVCQWSAPEHPWVMVGVFNSFDAELEHNINIGALSKCYQNNRITTHNSYMQLLHDLKLNIHKPDFPTDDVIELWADMRFDHTVTPEHFLLGFTGHVVGYDDLPDTVVGAIEQHFAQKQAQAIETHLSTVGHNSKRKI